MFHLKIIDNITESQISVEELEKTEITDKSAMDNDSDIVALLRKKIEFVKKSAGVEKRNREIGSFFSLRAMGALTGASPERA